MLVYLASPKSRHDAEYLRDMPVLLAYTQWKPYLRDHQQTFSRILVDSGAFSELTGAAKVDVAAYKDWSEQWRSHADAIAGLDDISGDWRRSLANYTAVPWGFPTMHDTDPSELLPELVAMARERGGWLGIGLKPPRENKVQFIRWVCERVPDGIHIHGWALRRYTHIRRLDSVDSTDWFRMAHKLKGMATLKHLTTGECMEIIIKRYQRWARELEKESDQLELIDGNL